MKFVNLVDSTWDSWMCWKVEYFGYCSWTVSSRNSVIYSWNACPKKKRRRVKRANVDAKTCIQTDTTLQRLLQSIKHALILFGLLIALKSCPYFVFCSYKPLYLWTNLPCFILVPVNENWKKKSWRVCIFVYWVSRLYRETNIIGYIERDQESG